MITKNFKSVVATLIAAGGAVDLLPVKTSGGSTYYLSANLTRFPYNVTTNVQISQTMNNGIYLGTGTTPPTENDYRLENVISSSSGISGATPTVNRRIDNDGNIYIEFTFLLSNSTNNDVTVNEIGYFQLFNGGDTQYSGVSAQISLMLDRTVLSTPVVVPANGSAAMKYKITASL